MTSNINPLYPIAGNPTTATVRANFSAAKSEIENIQSITDAAWQNLTGTIDITGLSSPPNKVPYKNLFPLNQFDANNVNDALITLHIPHDYVIGTSFIPHIHMLVSTLSSGVIRWGFDMIYADDYHASVVEPTSNQLFGGVMSGYIEHEIVPACKDAQLVIEFGEFAYPVIKPDTVLLVHLYRDATHVNDTYPDPCFLLYADMYYRSQSFGSIEH